MFNYFFVQVRKALKLLINSVYFPVIVLLENKAANLYDCRGNVPTKPLHACRVLYFHSYNQLGIEGLL